MTAIWLMLILIFVILPAARGVASYRSSYRRPSWLEDSAKPRQSDIESQSDTDSTEGGYNYDSGESER
jgi:hypothetical protein